jgi:hypothetical protein
MYCGKPAGFLRGAHKECRSAHEAGKAEIISLVQKAFHDATSLSSLKGACTQTAKTHYVRDADVSPLVVEGWTKAVDTAFEDGILTEHEESNLADIQKAFELEQTVLDKSGAYTRVAKGVVLRELVDGNLPRKVRVEGNLPFNFQKDEQLVWLFQGVEYYEQKTRRHYEGRSSGVSIRIAKGVYYRTGGFKGHPVETTANVHVGRGMLAFTNKNLYFAGDTKGFRIPYKKIVAYEPYTDGIGIQRDAATAKPQTFITGDGWFTYNLAMNVSRL